MTKAVTLYGYLDDLASQGFEITLEYYFNEVEIEVKDMENKFSTTIFNYHGEQEELIKKIDSMVALMKLFVRGGANERTE